MNRWHTWRALGWSLLPPGHTCVLSTYFNPQLQANSVSTALPHIYHANKAEQVDGFELLSFVLVVRWNVKASRKLSRASERALWAHHVTQKSASSISPAAVGHSHATFLFRHARYQPFNKPMTKKTFVFDVVFLHSFLFSWICFHDSLQHMNGIPVV